ncbi:hypothetical protein WEB32_00335 [Streptomyces netropsis]|uniref:hypothetical protein n=1 Tax=Streptomyces netropsis TaxID=55404 RepID=UPI0030CFE42F
MSEVVVQQRACSDSRSTVLARCLQPSHRCGYYENLELKKKTSAQGKRLIATLPASDPWTE